MKLNACILTILLLAMLCGVLPAAESVYPGSKLVFDMNLTDKDFLPAIKQMLPNMSTIIRAKMTGGQGGENPQVPWAAMAQQVATALNGLKSVSVSYFELANPDAAKLTQFYAPKIGLSEGWNPVVRVEGPQNQGSFRLYVKPGLEEIFGLAASPKGYVVVHTIGPIDVTKLAQLSAEMIPAIMTMRTPTPMPEPAPAPGPAVEVPAPEPAQ